MSTGSEATLIQILAGSVLGLFGGVGATALWEGLVKPYRECRNIARSLATEIRLNRDKVNREIKARGEDPRHVPLNLRLFTGLFDSVAERIAELPEELLPDIITLYSRFVSMNALRERLTASLQSFDESEGTQKARSEEDLESGLRWLDEGLELIAGHCDELLPKLVRYGRFTSEPWVQLAEGRRRPSLPRTRPS